MATIKEKRKLLNQMLFHFREVAEVKPVYDMKVSPSSLKKITGSEDCANILRQFFDTNTLSMQEQFVAMFLNRNNGVICVYCVSKGGVAGTVVDAKLILQMAHLTLASGVVLCHNHPSGNTKASEADKRLTNNIKEACKLSEIELLDHIILTQDSYLSFADEGLV